MGEANLKELALLRCGLFSKYNCGKCTEEQSVERDCGGDTPQDVPFDYDKLTGDIYRCPVALASTESTLAFIDEYDYYEKYPSSAPKYSEVSWEFWNNVKQYDSHLYNIRERDTATNTQNPEDNKSKMAGLFNK